MILFIVIYFSALFFLWKGLKKTEIEGDVKTMRKTSIWLALVFGLLAILPILAHKPDRSLFNFYLVWPLLYAVIFRGITRFIITPARKIQSLRYLVIFFLLWVLEIFLIIDYGRTGYKQNYGVENKIIYGTSQAFGQHLFVYMGFYIGIAMVVGYFLWKYKISLTKAFIIGGLWGIIVEQNFLGPILLVTNPLSFLTFGPLTFITYGMYIAGPYLLFFEEIRSRERKETKYLNLKFFLAISIIPLIAWALWTKLIGW
jgi:hypothetical protein